MNRAIKYIVVHSTQSECLTEDSYDFLLRTRRESTEGIRSKFHFLIHLDGSTTRIMGKDYVARWDFDGNENCLHVAYFGGMLNGQSHDTRTPDQWFRLSILLEYLQKQFPKAKMVGADFFLGELKKTIGFSLDYWLKFFKHNPTYWIDFEIDATGQWKFFGKKKKGENYLLYSEHRDMRCTNARLN